MYHNHNVTFCLPQSFHVATKNISFVNLCNMKLFFKNQPILLSCDLRKSHLINKNKQNVKYTFESTYINSYTCT